MTEQAWTELEMATRRLAGDPASIQRARIGQIPREQVKRAQDFVYRRRKQYRIAARLRTIYFEDTGTLIIKLR